MRERPILFSAAMVRAVLDGSKVQTRRVIKLREFGPSTVQHAGFDWHFRDRRLLWNDVSTADLIAKKCPYGEPGDLLWVRETFAIDDYRYIDGPLPKAQPADVFRVGVDHFCKWRAPLYYRADGECCEQIPECQCRMDGRGRFWRPSIHMPRWASRLTLRVTDVRVERVQDISEEDAKAEGVTGHDPEPADEGGTIYAWPGRSSAPSPRAHFAHLWDSINGRRPGCSWADNPWTWAVSFERVERP